MKNRVFSLLLVLLTSACSSMLPKAHTDTTSFESFEEARKAIESLVPLQSDRRTMEKNGFEPARHPNTTILTHADVVRRFVPSALLKREDLNPGILACLEARDACRGLEIIGAKIRRERTGNFWADFFNFRRHTEVRGWRFNALVLFVDDMVVYRTWGGQPVIRETEQATNPLGPFQDIGPATVTTR